MKARVKATGEIVEVNRPYINPFSTDICCDAKENNYPYLLDELEFDFVNEPDYWERLKHQYAGMAMQGLMAEGECVNMTCSGLAELSVKYATALIEKLKEEK